MFTFMNRLKLNLKNRISKNTFDEELTKKWLETKNKHQNLYRPPGVVRKKDKLLLPDYIDAARAAS